MLDNEDEVSEEQTSNDYGLIHVSSKRGIHCYKLRSGRVLC